MFEGFIADNYYYINLTELIEWCEKVIKPCREEDFVFDDFIQLHSLFDVRDRLLGKILNTEENDEIILEKYLESFTDEELSFLYYKNNLLSFMSDHEEISDLIVEIFDNVETLEYANKDDEFWLSKVPSKYQQDFVGKTYKDWNKFVNKQFFMDPNDAPECIANQLYELKEYLMKYVYCRFLSPDRIYRLKNFKRKVVTVIDTDSNILSLDTSVDFIFDNILKGQTFGRNHNNNIYICINMLAYVLSSAVEDILLTYGEYSNIPEEYRPIYSMKNEFLFLRLVIGQAKKRYMSKITLREGNLIDPPKYDIKGFDFKKATCSEYAEEVYMKIIKKYILNSDRVDLKGILRELKDFRNEIKESIIRGERTYLPNASAKELGAYKNPESEQSVRGVIAWNLLNPDNRIDLPSKVSLIKLNIFDEEDIEDLQKIHPEIYNIIIDKIFNDTTGIFVQRTRDNGISYANPKQEDWYKNIPKKYQAKYKKLGVDAWNDFVDTIDLDSGDDEVKGAWQIKKRGMQVLAIPSNATIPEWIQPYIDYSTMINNILAPMNPVLEIFKTQTIEEGKTRKGVNRKTDAFTNIIKF